MEVFKFHIIRYVVTEITENSADEIWNVKTKTFLSKNRGAKIEKGKIIYKLATDYQSSLTIIEDINGTVLNNIDEPVIEYIMKVPQVS